jgi:hypothetical protein
MSPTQHRLSLPANIAFAAVPSPAAVYPGVRLVKKVSVLTVRYGRSRTPTSAGSARSEILSAGHSPQVSRITTTAVGTEVASSTFQIGVMAHMVDVEPLGNRSDDQFIGKPMHVYRSPRRSTCVYGEASVPVFLHVSQPRPAFIRASFLYPIPEPVHLPHINRVGRARLADPPGHTTDHPFGDPARDWTYWPSTSEAA